MKRYVIWNNKGGVGKSTIVFNLAARYAERNSGKRVLVLDLCPQANLTMTMLGGGVTGEEHLLALQASSQSIVGYVDERINALSATAKPQGTYHLQVSIYNQAMPDNLFLVPGDGNLELAAAAIRYYADAQMPATAWENVHRWALDLIERITNGSDEWIVFIDTNPSFSIYTELAIVAGTHLLVPFKADDSSRVATKALFALLYGSLPPHPVYGRYTFAAKAQAVLMSLPLCHLFIGNQFTQYLGSASAFRSMSEAVTAELFAQYQANPQRYTARGNVPSQQEFEKRYIYELRDFNSAGVVAAHHGRLLSQLAESTYSVHQGMVSLDKSRISECSKSVDAIVNLL